MLPVIMIILVFESEEWLSKVAPHLSEVGAGIGLIAPGARGATLAPPVVVPWDYLHNVSAPPSSLSFTVI